MYEGFFATLFSTVQGYLHQFQYAISGLVTAVALVAGFWQWGQAAWTLGLEGSARVGKQAAGIVIVVFCLVHPWPGVGSILGDFPAATIKGGFVTANTILAASPGEFGGSTIDNVAGKIESRIKKSRADFFTVWQSQLAAVVADYNKATPIAINPRFWYFIILQLLIFLVIVVPLALFCSICPLALIPIMIASWFLGGMVAGELTSVVLNKDLVFKLMMTCIDYLALSASDFIFYAVAFFSYAIMMIMFAIRAVIFCTIFPISVITVPFPQRRQVFFNNIWKVFTFALTPAVLSIVLVICVEAYCLLSQQGGLLEQIRDQYLGNAPAWKMSTDSVQAIAKDGISMAGDLLNYIGKALVYILLGPATLSFVAAKVLWSAPKMLDELLGAGISMIDARIPGASQASHVATRAVI